MKHGATDTRNRHVPVLVYAAADANPHSPGRQLNSLVTIAPELAG